jgi:hypothetical protein
VSVAVAVSVAAACSCLGVGVGAGCSTHGLVAVLAHHCACSDARSSLAAVLTGQGDLLVFGGASILPRPLASFERLHLLVFAASPSSPSSPSLIALPRLALHPA